MVNKKSIVTAAVLAALTLGTTVAQADNSNNLLQMDVKRSSATDSVDVTFYTTGGATNSVVTRKSSNRYVVLLPNVAGSSSVVPGLGGVKDLITDIDVKNVDDGIGGYTKVTFGTTKPVNIKTYMKKTAPLTQAQKDYKNLISQNHFTAVKPQSVAKSTQTHANVTKSSVAVKHSTTKKATTEATKIAKHKTNDKTTFAKNLLPKVSSNPINILNTKHKEIAPKKNTQYKKVQSQKIANNSVSKPVVENENNYTPKMKYDNKGNRQIDLEPRVSHNVVEEKMPQAKSVKEDPLFALPKDNQNAKQQTKSKTTAVKTPNVDETSKSNLPLWLFITGGVALALLVVFLVFDAISHASEKDSDRLKSFFSISSKNQAKRRKREYSDIIEDDELSWQDKYKLYTEKDKKFHPVAKSADINYVTDLSGSKKAVIEDNNSEKDVSMSEFKRVVEGKNLSKSHKEELQNRIQSSISRMEHSLSQTPDVVPPEEVSNEVRSEDNIIMNNFSDIKLKSFAKQVTLKETHRSLLEEDKKQSRNKSYKEGRFVKLKNSPLSVSRRKSVSSDLNASDLMNMGNKYLTNNNGEMKMDKQNENYLLTSLDEYLSILDSEDSAKSNVSVADALSQVRPSKAMSRSGITNPIEKASNPMEKSNDTSSNRYMNGLIVKSGYNIDSEKGFYVVNLDGVSALVGRIKDNIFVLKKFDYAVDKPIQVRLDYGTVYIVKVGGFKCLVDVSKEKMGTLIEI